MSKNPDEIARFANTLDFILNTVAAPHDLDAFLLLLKGDGTMTLAGAPDSPHPSPTVFNLIFKRRSLAGSLIGDIQETQGMLDFCAKHGIVSNIEMIDIQNVNEAYERMIKGDVKYRFVIDMDSLKKKLKRPNLLSSRLGQSVEPLLVVCRSPLSTSLRRLQIHSL